MDINKHKLRQEGTRYGSFNPEAIAYMQKYNHKDILLSIEKITS